MSDLVDVANYHAQVITTATLKNIRARQLVGISMANCEDCGDDIPIERQKAVVGVRLCIDCQTKKERLKK